MVEFKVNVSQRWWVRYVVRLVVCLATLRAISPRRAYRIAMWAAKRGMLVNGRRMGV